MRYFFKLILLFCICSSILFASLVSKYEQEPNDLAVNATVVRGSKSLIGTLNQTERDNFLWKVSGKDSTHSWDLTLMPLPNSTITLEISKVTFQKAGISTVSFSKKAKELKEKTKLFTFTNDTRSKTLTLDGMLFKKGEYLITIYTKENEKSVPYKLTLEKKSIARYDTSRNKTDAQNISFAKNTYFYKAKEQVAWFQFTVDEKHKNLLWQFDSSSYVNENTIFSLLNDEGEVLVKEKPDAYGKISLTNLELDEGKYYVKYQANDTNIYGVSIYSTGVQGLEKNEIEPNNSLEEANNLHFSKVMNGSVGYSEDKKSKDAYDYYQFSIPKKFKNKQFSIKVKSIDKNLLMRLYDENNVLLQVKQIDSNYTMSNLQLISDKRYFLLISNANQPISYEISISEAMEINKTTKLEPNDYPKDALLVDTTEKIEGIFEGDESDCYRFNIDKSNNFWTFETEGNGLENMVLYQNDKIYLVTNEKQENRLSFANLFLLRGYYNLCLRGNRETYQLKINNKNIQEMNISSLNAFEKEPNQGSGQANRLTFNQTKQGVLENVSNEDFFHFTLENSTNIRLTATPPKEGAVQIKLSSNELAQYAYPKVGEDAVIEGLYPSGKYTVNLFTKKPNFNYYKLKLERLNPFSSKDSEPNDDYVNAIEVTQPYNLKGHTSSHDIDYYRLPKTMNETNITIRGKNLEGNIRIYPNDKDYALPLEWNTSTQSYHTTLKTPQSSYIYVYEGVGYYDYNLSFSNYPSSKLEVLALTLDLEVSGTEVAAYNDKGQYLSFVVNLENKKDTNQTLQIETHTSDRRWKVISELKEVKLKSNEKKALSFQLKIPKNVSKDEVVTSIKLSALNTKMKTVSFTVLPKDEVLPKKSYRDWGVPALFLGGINVANVHLGAKRVLEHNETSLGYVPKIGKNYHYLFDNIAYTIDGFYLYAGRKVADENVTVELLGDTPLEIVGVTLNPKSYGYKSERLKDFSISLSLDGKIFKKVYNGTLENNTREQYFSFDTSYLARYARLTLHNNHKNDPLGKITLGEWKVIAPNSSIFPTFNIAEPKFGGHIIKSSRYLSANWNKYLLTAKEDLYTSQYFKEGEKLSFVVGFKNERTAKISSIVWNEVLKSEAKTRFSDVSISISTQTPNGPWIELAKWDKNATIDQNSSKYILEEPRWAKYVRFTANTEEKKYYYPPQQIVVYEEKVSEKYKSILAEWGETNHESFYEYQKEKEEKVLSLLIGNETEKSAYSLENNVSVRGSVSVAKHQKDWYKIDVPKGENSLAIDISNKESIDVTYILYDSNHTVLTPTSMEKEPLIHMLKYEVSEGSYFLQIKQPSISVVFAWDNSGSVSPYHEEVFASVNEYVSLIEKNIDAVNLLCFNTGNKFLLSDFSDNPEEVQWIYNDFDQNCNSSDAESALNASAKSLEKEEGIKGVIIIADAAGSHDKTLWNSLEKVRPKVFSIRVASGYRDNEVYEGLMQSWSRINNGTYSVVENSTEMTKAIKHATHTLRRPVFYNLNMKTSYVRPLADGSLKVLASKSSTKKSKKSSDGFAIELILDASGSMLKRIKGKRRIEIAKAVLKKAVQEIIPPKTLVALRVFGHKKADSCRTDLEMRLQTLNVKKTTKIIANIKAKNLAKTPIAASLAQVANDLKKVKGKRVIILVTDGKETCDGNITEEIEKLKALGVDVRLNIVGFAIDNEALKKEFALWAKLGNGAYFEANDKDSLENAVKEALKVPYKVYDLKDKLLLEGIVGDESLKLKGGVYKVIVDSYPKQVFEKVFVKGEEETSLNLDEKNTKGKNR